MLKTEVAIIVRTEQFGNVIEMVTLDTEPVPDDKHPRDERAIAKAVKRLADRIAKEGTSFEGRVVR